MKTQETTTTNLAEFGWREKKILIDLLTAEMEQGFPEDFEDSEVVPMFNRNNGNVFFTNSKYQVLMLHGNKLKMWNYCFNCGHEGFEEYCQLQEDGCNECRSGGIGV